MTLDTPSATATEELVEIDGMRFPPFDLDRLLTTVFELKGGERFAVFTDLADPSKVKDLDFLEETAADTPQHHAYHTLFKGIEASGVISPSSLAFFAYAEVGGSNLELPKTVFATDGTEHELESILGALDIVLYMGTWSATAPITALAKKIGFRGATMHGTNDKVLATGLAVDYNDVSARAERLRSAMSNADAMTLEWTLAGRDLALRLELGGQEAQKSHGLVRTMGDVANLPAGEVYYVPTGGTGLMPIQFEDEQETIAVFHIDNGAIQSLESFHKGDEGFVKSFLETIAFDPAAGMLTELGLGTQTLPWAHCDIQDEKIVGTAHVATGRSDHLGGAVGPQSFKDLKNASHNDILYTPEKTPEIQLRRVTMHKGDEDTLILEDYVASEFISKLL
jgi:hypothetical protein